MKSLLDVVTDRESLLKYIAQASVYGNLGLFIGSGFSKAVVNEPHDEPALSWGPLLMKAVEVLELDDLTELPNGMSLPAFASVICRALAKKEGGTFDDASLRLKRKIAEISSWYAGSKHRARFGPHLRAMRPGWVITTNYDLVFESLMPGQCVSLTPDTVATARRGWIPTYHLHGMRTDPASLIVTEEDYVRLFRPSNYRQVKLATMLKESTTLIMGYGLGDVNVLTAIDWVSHVFSEVDGEHPRGVIQVVRDVSVSEPVKQDKLIVIGMAEIEAFLIEVSEAVIQEKALADKRDSRLKVISDALADSTTSLASAFIDDETRRKVFIGFFRSAENELVAPMIDFLERVFGEAWTRAQPDGAFAAYDQQLNVLIDLLAVVRPARSPALFRVLADALARLSAYVGEGSGESWAAAKTWKKRRDEIPEETLKDLRAYANHNSVSWKLNGLLK